MSADATSGRHAANGDPPEPAGCGTAEATRSVRAPGAARPLLRSKNPTRVAYLLDAAQLVALILAAPILMFPQRLSPFGLLLLVLPLIARLLLEGYFSIWTPADPALALLGIMVIVGVVVSVDPYLSMERAYGIALGMATYYAVATMARTASRRSLAAGLLAGASVPLSLVSLVGTSWKALSWGPLHHVQAWLPHFIASVQGSVERASGFNPNEVGGALGLVLPVLVASILFRRPSRWTTPAVLALSVVVPTLLLSESRGAMAGCALAVLLLFGWRWRWCKLLWLTPPLMLATGTMYLGPARLASLFLALDIETGSSSIGTRLELWQRALAMIADFPLTGIGLNTVSIVSPRLFPVLAWPPDRPIPHVHDLFLQTALDLGVPGLIAFLWLLWHAARSLLLAWRDRSRPERWIVAGLAASLVSHLTFGLSDAIVLGAKPGFLLWAVLGLSMVIGGKHGHQSLVSRVDLSC